jgi:hypothetical protein
MSDGFVEFTNDVMELTRAAQALSSAAHHFVGSDLEEYREKQHAAQMKLLKSHLKALDKIKALEHGLKPLKCEITPHYVSASDKVQILEEIVQDYYCEHPEALGISFQTVLSELRTKYKISTRTIGNFFKDQLPAYETYGGNRKKFIRIREQVTKGITWQQR